MSNLFQRCTKITSLTPPESGAKSQCETEKVCEFEKEVKAIWHGAELQTAYLPLKTFIACLYDKNSKSSSFQRHTNATHLLGKEAIQWGWFFTFTLWRERL